MCKRNSAPQRNHYRWTKIRFSRLGYDAQKIKGTQWQSLNRWTKYPGFEELRSGKKNFKKGRVAWSKSYHKSKLYQRKSYFMNLHHCERDQSFAIMNKRVKRRTVMIWNIPAKEQIKDFESPEMQIKKCNLFSFIEGEAVMPGHWKCSLYYCI